jgi:hypothetical protein
MAHNLCVKCAMCREQNVKDATRRKIIDAMRTQIEMVLGPLPPTLPTAYREMYAGLSKGLGGEVNDATLDQAFRSSVMLGLWKEAENGLKDRPEPTPEQLQKMLAEMGELDFAWILRSFVKRVSRKIPPFPPGKRPSLKPWEEKEAVAKVRELTNKRALSRKRAYEEVAQTYKVHWRTIQNLWIKAQQGIEQHRR